MSLLGIIVYNTNHNHSSQVENAMSSNNSTVGNVIKQEN